MRLTDIFIALPQLPLLLVLMMLFREPLKATFGVEGGVFLLMVCVIGGLQWMPTAPFGARRSAHREIARIHHRRQCAVGSQDGRDAAARHILPNVMSPVIVAATFSVGGRHHHRIGAVLSRLGLPARFPDLGALAL